jgi:glycosyltransferase involved in cell wall biosynthesis
MLLSILVPCRNEATHIGPCLASILAQKLDGHQLEVLVADGRSTDGTRTLLEDWAVRDPRVRIIDNPGQIVSTGLNAALREARGEIIIRMDAHTTYAPTYLWECVRVLEATGADNVGGPWVARGVGTVGRAIAAVFHTPLAVGGARSHDPTYEGPVESVYLGCWRRDVFDRIGTFDEMLVRNQDDEFNLRLVRAGGRIWQSPRIRSWYQPRRSLRALWRQHWQNGYWKVPVLRKHGRPASLRHLVPAGFMAAVLLLAAAAPFGTLPRTGLAWLLTLYGDYVGVASLQAAWGQWDLLPLVPLVIVCTQWAYGLGFLSGLWGMALRRSPHHGATTLTRPAQENTQG